MRIQKFTKEQMASPIDDGFEIVVDQKSAIITGDFTLAVFRPVTGGMFVRIPCRTTRRSNSRHRGPS
jgi:hypothetical protein